MTSSKPRLRIGELAELAGTTTRAVRYYHSIGLLREPERDASGYRRYGPEHLIRLVRIRRLRTLDMPLEQIAMHLSSGEEKYSDIQTSLGALADDIGRQIDELQALRQRILHMVATKTGTPTERWEESLRAHGLLEGGLPAEERAAVELIDALHPEGIDGVIEQSSSLLGDPAFAERLKPLLERFHALPDDDAAIEELAREVAPLFPRGKGAPAVDVETMDKLVGSRLTAAQRLFLRRLRQLIEAGAE
jgi:DNA-binding transcriptional MerR regulator